MEYCAPESLMVDREGRLMELGREGDLWSLGSSFAFFHH